MSECIEIIWMWMYMRETLSEFWEREWMCDWKREREFVCDPNEERDRERERERERERKPTYDATVRERGRESR